MATTVTDWVVPPSAETPGPSGLMIRLFPEMENLPLLLEFGGPKFSVPANGLPSLQLGVMVATTVPAGALLVMLGLAGLKLSVR